MRAMERGGRRKAGNGTPGRKPLQLKRWFRHKLLMLLRAPGGAAFVALGFSIGMAIEMVTLPTMGLAFFLLFPLVYVFRASMAGALIGFLIGKIIFIPIAFLSGIVGGWILPAHLHVHISFLPHFVNKFIGYNLKLIVGGLINGILLGILFYFPVRQSITFFTERRRKKRKERRADTVATKPAVE
ncbi:DUF2062 domain-containing protein [Paenibacillus sp. MMS18-CY102]|uniref:DUF2062 domain-containing protein n=1 Tax=Paenibacillus sp. MMS18-CY102 TaxID=2682849 RepID=UPI0013657FB4|nr:DUF2062 domain-containing protein [Paenibacillus sp. MMS18-CY102]MWC26852.1 DUF2062 domain-containing protein [Paenibacillus sp. MMS18-CY102]